MALSRRGLGPVHAAGEDPQVSGQVLLRRHYEPLVDQAAHPHLVVVDEGPVVGFAPRPATGVPGERDDDESEVGYRPLTLERPRPPQGPPLPRPEVLGLRLAGDLERGGGVEHAGASRSRGPTPNAGDRSPTRLSAVKLRSLGARGEPP